MTNKYPDILNGHFAAQQSLSNDSIGRDAMHRVSIIIGNGAQNKACQELTEYTEALPEGKYPDR